MQKLFCGNASLSVREAAIKLNLPKTKVAWIKTKKFGLKAFRMQTAPKYCKDQKQRAKRSCRNLTRQILPSGENRIVILDDETYVLKNALVY